MPDAIAEARRYQEARERIVALVAGSDCSTAVPACPGWSVQDVVAHMTAVAEDWVAGRLSGPPTDDVTAAQVARLAGIAVPEILAAWHDAATQLDRLAETEGLAPPLGDIVIHEHDIRGALGQPGARDSAGVRSVSDELLTMLDSPVPMRVAVEDAEYRSGPDHGAEIQLRTTRFEVVRWRSGRRSRAQLAAMDWSGDPTPVLDHLYLFGPAAADLVE